MTITKKRLVLDTNTLISAFQNETSSSASFFKQVKYTHELLVSDETVRILTMREYAEENGMILN